MPSSESAHAALVEGEFMHSLAQRVWDLPSEYYGKRGEGHPKSVLRVLAEPSDSRGRIRDRGARLGGSLGMEPDPGLLGRTYRRTSS